MLDEERQKNQQLQDTIFRHIGIVPQGAQVEQAPTFVDTRTARKHWVSIKSRLEEMARQPREKEIEDAVQGES